MYSAGNNGVWAAPQPQYPHQLAEGSKAPHQRQRQAGLSTPFRPTPLATPFSEMSDSASGTTDTYETADEGHNNAMAASRTSKRYQRDADVFTAWCQDRAERKRAEHIARVQNTTARRNPYVSARLPVRAITPAAQAGGKGSGDGDGRGMRVKYKWTEVFRMASVTSDARVRIENSRTVAWAGRWDSVELTALVGMLIERVVGGSGQNFVPVAPYAKDLHDALNERDTAFGAMFKTLLTQSVRAEFEAWWHPDKSSTLVNSVFSLEPKVLAAGLAVADFISDLFTAALVPADTVFHCLHILVNQIATVEQLRGVRHMLTRVDIRLKLANPGALDAVMNHLGSRHQMIQTTCIAEPFNPRDSAVQMQEIGAIVTRWNKPDEPHDAQEHLHRMDSPRETATQWQQQPPSFWSPAVTPTPVIWQSAQTGAR